MKNFKTILASAGATVVMIALTLNFNACSEQTPLDAGSFDAGQFDNGQLARPDSASQAILVDGPLSLEQVNAISAPKEKIQVAEKDLKIIKSNSGTRFQKRFVSFWYIPLGSYGWTYTGDDLYGKCWLYFPPYAMNQTTTISMDWESTGFLEGGAQFSPDGTQFNTPVTVWISYKDADLGDINELDLKLWYFNEATSMWELIGDTVDTANKMVGGLLNHFSRYALGVD